MHIRFIRLVYPVFLAAMLLNACSSPSSTQENPPTPNGTSPTTPVPEAAIQMAHPASQTAPGAAATEEPVAVTGSMPPHTPAEASPVEGHIAGLASSSDLREVLDLLLSEHVLLEASASGAILTLNQAGYTAAANALEANAADLAAVLGSIYGLKAAEGFLPIWEKHTGYGVSYTTAQAAHDPARHDEAIQSLLASPAELGATFHAIEPNLPGDMVSSLFETHVTSMKQIIDLQAANDPVSVYATLRDARTHMRSIAREFTVGIAARFPDRFPDEAGDGPAELRSTLTLLLSEHIYLAAAATKAALKGKQAEFDAAAGVMELNAIDLAAAVGSTYGQEAQEAFLPLWRGHVGFAAEYTNSLVKNDIPGQRKALESLLAYPQALGTFFNSINPNLPVDAVAGMEEDHIRSLIEIIDSQNVGNEAAAFSLLRHAYAHTGAMAGLLAEGTLNSSLTGTLQAGMVKQVEISVFAFVPNEIEVPVGTTIIWTNRDETVHTVTVGSVGDAGDDFDSAPFGTGESFAYLFSKPGEYPYFCRVHPEMVGLVRVVP